MRNDGQRDSTAGLVGASANAAGTGSSGSSGSSNVVGVHYKVGKKIGEGSFGVIFEGKSQVPEPISPVLGKGFVFSLLFRSGATLHVIPMDGHGCSLVSALVTCSASRPSASALSG